MVAGEYSSRHKRTTYCAVLGDVGTNSGGPVDHLVGYGKSDQPAC